MWCGLSSRGLIRPVFFTLSVIGAYYLRMLQNNIIPDITDLHRLEECYFQQDGGGGWHEEQMWSIHLHLQI